MDNKAALGCRRIALIVAALAVCALFLVSTYNGIRSLLYQENTEYILRLTVSGGGHLEAAMAGYLESMKNLARFFSESRNQQGERKRLEAFAEQFLLENDFDTVYIADSKGNVFRNQRHYDISERKYFAYGISGSSFVSEPLYDMVSGNKVIIFGSPIIQNGEPQGLALATKRVGELSRPLSIVLQEDAGDAYFVDVKGDVIASSGSEGKVVENVLELIADNGSYNRIKEDMRRAMDAERQWSGRIYDGSKTCFFCMVPVRVPHMGTGSWYIVSVIPEDSMMGNARLILWRILLLSSFVVGIVLLGGGFHWIYSRRYQNHIERLAYYDSLTGIHNVNYLKEHAKRMLLSQEGEKRAYVAFDINKFKIFNERFGYEMGNQALCTVGAVLTEALRENEMAVRVANDTFGLLLDFRQEEELERRLDCLNDDLEEACRGIGAPRGSITYSFGVFVIEDQSIPLDKVMDYADIARKQIKSSAGGRIEYYDAGILKVLQQEKAIEDEMGLALRAGEFVPYLQPKVDIRTEAVVGAEALVRWVKPDGTMRPPGMFVPLFEKNGFITKVDYHIFEEVCKLKQKLKGMDRQELVISVNMSRNHLRQPDFVETLCEIADRYGCKRNMLEIEVTENVYFEDVDTMTKVVMDLKKAGFLISMDDFGSGYSSLNLLKELPIDVLKLDGGFLNESRLTQKGAKIIESVLRMGEYIGVDVICEGVETDNQVQFLLSIGCQKAQGYYYYRPMPVADYIREFI